MRRLQAILLALAVVAIITLLLVLIALSPLLLAQVKYFDDQDWHRLSEIGQSYGAASASLSAFALIGVGLGIAYQGRQVYAQRQQAARQFHLELVKMNLEQNDLYGPSWGPQEALEPRGRLRHLYTNQVILYLMMAYETDIIDERALRGVLADMFHGAVAREYWKVAGAFWWEHETAKRSRRKFVAIVQEEHDKAVAEAPPVVLEDVKELTSTAGQRSDSIRPILIGMALGMIVAKGLARARQ